MKVFVGGRAVQLRRSDFLADGGEGNVYVQGATAFKIYHAASKMIPQGKMDELAKITDARVLRPQEPVVDSSGVPVGYTMRYASGAHVLCQVIPRAFRARHGIDADETFALVEGLRTGIEAVHRAGVLLVDVNEMNFLVSAAFDEVFFIDVDSYQTPHYPATALLPSVRDWHCRNGFDQGSDWFSFAVLSFQVLTGLHPYKGKHPDVKRLAERMKQNLSVFDPSVRTPPSWDGLDLIPPPYRAWYRAVLQEGKRLPPPAQGGAVPMIAVKPTRVPAGVLSFRELWQAPAPIVGMASAPHGLVAWTGEGVYQNGRRLADAPQYCLGIGYVPTTGAAVAAGICRGKLVLKLLADGSEVSVDLRADAGMVCEGQIYVRCRDKMVAVCLLQAGARILAAPQRVGQVLPLATTVWPGVVLQNLLGAFYAYLYPRLGGVRQVRVPQLDGAKILSATFEKAVLVVTTVRHGKHERWVFRFDVQGFWCDTRKEVENSSLEANLAVLDTGICVCACGDDGLEIFWAQMDKQEIRRLENTGVSGGLLYGEGHRLLLARGRVLGHVSLT